MVTYNDGARIYTLNKDPEYNKSLSGYDGCYYSRKEFAYYWEAYGEDDSGNIYQIRWYHHYPEISENPLFEDDNYSDDENIWGNDFATESAHEGIHYSATLVYQRKRS